MEKEKIIFQNYEAFGESIALTAVLRDLHQTYPDQFVTDVRTPYPAIFEHNPYVTRVANDDKNVRKVNVLMTKIDDCQVKLANFIGDHVKHVANVLNLPKLTLQKFAGEIHLAPWESVWCSQVADTVGRELPYWLIVSGGKRDFTTKWWGAQRFQQVVDAYRGRILFVQIGSMDDEHPRLNGVLDFRGKTDTRGLIRLMHRAQGVLCGITGPMHLSAATPMWRHAGRRPCVVIGGGREPMHFWSYPFHQNLSTVGTLPCCDLAGCWRARTVPLHDGRDQNHNSFCVDVVDNSPRCMVNIRPEVVIDAVERYYTGGRLAYLTPEQFQLVEPHLNKPQPLVQQVTA